MNKTETLIKEVQNSVDNNEKLESISHRVWNFTSIAHVVQLIQQLKDQEEFYTRYLKEIIKEKDNQDDQLLQLQSEYDEMQEERDSAQEGLETLQTAYDTLNLEDTQKANLLKIMVSNNMKIEMETLTKENEELRRMQLKLVELVTK